MKRPSLDPYRVFRPEKEDFKVVTEEMLDGKKPNPGFEEIQLEDEISRPGAPSCVRCVDQFTFDFLKTYLYALRSGALSQQDIKVIFLHALASSAHPVIVSPSVAFGTKEGLYKVENDLVQAKLRYKGASYYVCLERYNSPREEKVHAVHVSGAGPAARHTDELYNSLYKHSTVNSIYTNKILKAVLKSDSSDDDDVTGVNLAFAEPEPAGLDDLILPAETLESFHTFIKCVENYKQINMSLRYLLSGPPGTGKTKLIKAVINACKGKATILLAPSAYGINTVFEFANMFSPCLVCVDDLDMVAGERENNSQRDLLGKFLQKLDGFVKNNVFILATTNDKLLVDMAASRPGRFDAVIDVGCLNPANYSELLKKYCPDQELFGLFSEKVLLDLKAKKATGAFLVNLIKQLNIQKLVKEEKLTEEKLIGTINSLHKGFSLAVSENIGFGN